MTETSYIVAQIGLDSKGRWTVTYFGDVPEQGGIEFKRGQLTFMSLEDALEFTKREVSKHTDTYLKAIADKEKTSV